MISCNALLNLNENDHIKDKIEILNIFLIDFQ